MILYSLITGFADNATKRISERHQVSISHFRSAEVEFLKGVRAFLDEELEVLERWLDARTKSEQEPTQDTR